MDGLEASHVILDRCPLPIVVLTAYSDQDLIERAESIGVCAYLVKPFTQNNLQPAIALARSHFRQIRALKREIGDLKETVKAHKLIEKAKELLMQKEGISESEAFGRIQHLSRKQNIRMTSLAESIIINNRLAQRIKKLNRFRQE